MKILSSEWKIVADSLYLLSGLAPISEKSPIFKGSKMANNEKTSKGVASKASEQLKDKKSTPDQKSVAGSALTQTADKKKK